MSAAATATGKELLSLYRKILRSAAVYPSKNRLRIYEAIRQEFRENKSMDPKSDETQVKVSIAIKGLSQLKQFDEYTMTGGKTGSPNWTVNLEQNPMPKPEGYKRK
mmetsp:Transcript_27516/g.40437  ORF Transcript_27516/g.40437 Transcript_27516/m.40437 type:complete len:106 (-) Transcript_27516:106-423(-)|eukprot:CAMPEP_0194032346 /NCGR_PEP_ID=MMETSP0009_2-20130614/5310_1 /TAXON_ID=210454 /ORGANISM="Grammatophora oceanica, Strain CCMP 410" /LENGTH=105 /DNA_ID=CAMNT_0038672757 /DNA_START=224 /DNA_END=541 /DNA_ORIENTATION=+